MKLGAAMGEMAKPSKGGATKEAICESDAQCSDNETCKSGNCVNVCNPSPCPSDEFCLNEGNHSYSCVECTSNDQCDGREICKNNSCIDACTGNPCASKNQACSSQDGHSYICYGCVNNSACSGGKVCNTSSKSCVCPSGYEDDGNGGCQKEATCANTDCSGKPNSHCEMAVYGPYCYCNEGFKEDEFFRCVPELRCEEIKSEDGGIGKLYPTQSDCGNANSLSYDKCFPITIQGGTCWAYSHCGTKYVWKKENTWNYCASMYMMKEDIGKWDGTHYFCCYDRGVGRYLEGSS